MSSKEIKASKKLSEYQKINCAFQRATLDLERNSFAPDPFKYCDYNFGFEDTLQYLANDLKSHEYRPQRAENFDLPKGEYAIRPGVIVDVLDLTVINRLMSDFIVDLEKTLPAGVTAYRLKPHDKLQFVIDRETAYYILSRRKREKIKIEQPWYDLWPKFRKEIIGDLRKEEYKYVAKTDITGFFEDINFYILADILKEKTKKRSREINLIVEIYRNWSLRDPANVRQPRGLPQGSNTSGIFSNHYLSLLDNYLEDERKRGKIKWYRYCDDIYALCKTRPRAVKALLDIGRCLRRLGLKQNAEKTKVLTAKEALEEIHNEIADSIHEIMEGAKKKRRRQLDLVSRLRAEYKKFSKKRKINRKYETTLFATYTASSVLNIPLLANRVGKDFQRFPVRAKYVCRYARQFINYKVVYRAMAKHLKNVLLYNFQIAHLAAVFRNLKYPDESIFRILVKILDQPTRHWYVKEQIINTLGYLGPGFLKKEHAQKLLSKRSHQFVRRAALTLTPQCFSTLEVRDILLSIAKELNPQVSRMANFCLALMEDEKLAVYQLNRFGGLSYVFVGDQIWMLSFLAFNKNHSVRKKLLSLMTKFASEFKSYGVIKLHLAYIARIVKEQPSGFPEDERIYRTFLKDNLQVARKSKRTPFAQRRYAKRRKKPSSRIVSNGLESRETDKYFGTPSVMPV